MKVDDRNLNGIAGPQPGRTAETQEADRLGSASGGPVSQPNTGDRAEISSLAGRISGTLSAQSAQRAERVAALAKEYSAGSYRVDSKSTSSSIIQEALGNKDAAQ
jgi:anti-sigma28 factor (negative regulator of flagellin synthesis)